MYDTEFDDDEAAVFMKSDDSKDVLAQFLDRMQIILLPLAGDVSHGNIRHKVTHSQLEENRVTNVAITYESPGGSTNQINITYEHVALQFRVLSDTSGEEEHFADPAPIVLKVETLVASVPQIRMDRLKWDLDRWKAEGRTRAQMLATMSRYLQTDSGLRGGGITQDEFKEASRYIAQIMKADNGES